MTVVTRCDGLTDRLLEADGLLKIGANPDPYIAYALAALSAYAYSEKATVEEIAAQLGLDGYTCKKYEQFVDVMFIDSTAYLLRSGDGRVAILVYRGTNLASLINWLVDVEVDPEKVEIEFHDQPERFKIHRGFHRNLLATFDEIVAELQGALDKRSAAAGSNGEGTPEHNKALEALYITGHSLGAAMAAMAALVLRTDAEHQPIFDKLKPVYTYGQPMIGDRRLAERCDEPDVLRDKLIRYVFGHDTAAQLPPRASGDFAHFGREFRHPSNETVGDWRESRNTPQMRDLLELALLIPSFLTHQFARTRRLPFDASLNDHLPWHYIGTLTPDKPLTAPGYVGHGMSAPHSPL